MCTMPARGVAFARYLRKVHVEWCPFKAKATAPIFFQEIHTQKIMDSVPKLTITKAIRPRVASSDMELDRTKLTFADGSERVIDLTGLKLTDIIEEIGMENVRIQNEERTRGRPF